MNEPHDPPTDTRLDETVTRASGSTLFVDYGLLEAGRRRSRVIHQVETILERSFGLSGKAGWMQIDSGGY